MSCSCFAPHISGVKSHKSILSTAAAVEQAPIALPTTLKEQIPKAQLDGDNIKLYTGSCQCGAVSFVVKTAPLPEIEIKEDNCSICVRVGLDSTIAPSRTS